jgi:two-component system alkaline phosphatase synthesis response regulator PhoP
MLKKNITIFLVEDDHDLRDIYRIKFEKSGYRIIEIDNGDGVFDVLKKNIPDLILLDLVMPGKSGYEVLSLLKSDKTFKNIPVFILSNLGQEVEVKEGLRLKAEKYFIKANYTPAEIVSKVDEFFKVKK